MPQVNGASMMLTFSDKDARDKTIWQVLDAIHAEATATIPGLRRLQIKEMGSDVMATAAAPIHVNIYGPDLKPTRHNRKPNFGHRQEDARSISARDNVEHGFARLRSSR